MVLESTLREAIERIIDQGDLNTLTFKKIYRLLEKEFNEDLHSQKKFLRKTVSHTVTKKGEEQLIQVENGEIIKKNSSGDEEEDVDILGDKDATSEISEKKKDEEDEVVDIENVDEKEEQGPKQYIEASEKDKALQELIYESLKYGSSTERSTRSKRKKPMLSVSPKKKAKKNPVENGTKKKVAAGFAKPTVLSPSLAEFLGEEQLPRTEVVKRLHTYIKDHNLQNPKDKRKILFDDKLQEIFKCKTSDFFKINRLISKHVKPVDEVV